MYCVYDQEEYTDDILDTKTLDLYRELVHKQEDEFVADGRMACPSGGEAEVVRCNAEPEAFIASWADAIFPFMPHLIC